MAVEQPVGLAEGYGGKRVVLNVGQQVDRILDMSRPLCSVAHDRGRVLEGIANLTVGNAECVSRIRGRRLSQRGRRILRCGRTGSDGVVRKGDCVIVRTAEITPGDALFIERIADRAYGRGRYHVLSSRRRCLEDRKSVV